MLDVLGLMLGLALGQPRLLDPLLAPEIVFHPRERSVSNWRWQAAMTLDASPGTRMALVLGRDPPTVTRCVRLNNDWCIKRGGWSGEIAADADGHVAFVSASEGATVAALLLRRYYVDDGRRSALAIVSHWAPASCPALPLPRRGQASSVGLASRGIGRTLRARWLASHGHRLAGMGRGRSRVSAVPDRLIGAPPPAPTIALGLSPAPISLSATLPDVVSAGGSGQLPTPSPTCAGDIARIDHYAARASAGIAGSITADLKLFDAAGMPTPNLAKLMRNMASVEIGPLGVGEGLVEAAVTHAVDVIAARRAAALESRTAPENRMAPSRSPGAPPPGYIDEARRPEPRP